MQVFSIHRAGHDEVLSAADVEEAATTHTVLPLDLMRFARAHVRALALSRRAYLATLRYALRRAPSGAKAKLWQVFYFAESIVVWDGYTQSGIRHLHAHFANVAADVAWLAAEFGRRSDPERQWDRSFTMHGPLEFYEVDGLTTSLARCATPRRWSCISDFCRRS